MSEPFGEHYSGIVQPKSGETSKTQASAAA